MSEIVAISEGKWAVNPNLITALVQPQATQIGKLAPADFLNEPTYIFPSIQAAISTSVIAVATASITAYCARISWQNISAAGNPLLYIAVNCGNIVEGLVASQSALQRDHVMSLGDVVTLVSPVPISTLAFSSDSSLAVNTHRIKVVFGN